DDLPVICEYQKDTWLSSLASTNTVYSNTQQIHSERDTSLTKRVPADCFDMIIVDEAHNAPASCWRHTLAHCSKA
ncbi:DEAD/DEAH box helicase family protein, partial [Pseudomonas aeruginosa]